jgi:hypothetical protein
MIDEDRRRRMAALHLLCTGAMRIIRLLTVGVALSIAGTATAQPPGMQPATPIAEPALHKEGILHAGISIEPLGIGAIHAITPHGTVTGLDLLIALQVDLGPHWAFRLPIELGAGGTTSGAGYGELAIIPGAIYRFRSSDDQRWVPYVGGGLRLGVVDIGRTLVGKPLQLTPVPLCCHDWDWDHGGHSDPNAEDTSTLAGGPSPELWAGTEWNPSRWFSLQLAGAIGYERVFATSVVVIRETLGLRLVF